MSRILKTYKNSTPVIRINNYPMKVEDIVEACLISGLNLLLVGERGEGKTQILYDVLYGVFGGNGTYIRTSPDMEIKDVYTALNLEKLKEKTGTSKDILEITEEARHPFTAIDELNRAPPIVQNQLLNVLDGYIEVKGKRYELGIPIGKNETYHVGIATINLGNHRYIGTFSIDSAILDRFGVTLNLDYYPPTVKDITEILFDEPRLTVPSREDRTQEIIRRYKEVKKRKIPLEFIISALFLREGVDYISAEPYSQRKTGGRIPEGVHEEGGIQSLIYPLSIRTIKQARQLYKALSYVAEERGYEENEDHYLNNSLEVLKIVLPYSGSIKPEIVNSRYDGNYVWATEEIIKLLREEIEGKKEKIAMAIVKKKKGTLDESDLEEFDKEWKFMRDLLLCLG